MIFTLVCSIDSSTKFWIKTGESWSLPVQWRALSTFTTGWMTCTEHIKLAFTIFERILRFGPENSFSIFSSVLVLGVVLKIFINSFLFDELHRTLSSTCILLLDILPFSWAMNFCVAGFWKHQHFTNSYLQCTIKARWLAAVSFRGALVNLCFTLYYNSNFRYTYMTIKNCVSAWFKKLFTVKP